MLYKASTRDLGGGQAIARARRAFASALGLLILVAVSAPVEATPIVISFEDVIADGIVGNDSLPGNWYASLGVTFTTGSIADGPFMVGDIITLSGPLSEFEVVNSAPAAISDPNLALARFGGANDLLMSFDTPVMSVALTSDEFPEPSAEIIRLLALAETPTANQYRILGFVEGPDDAISSPANLLSLNLGGTPFSFALFQAIGEQEGFDNLTFAPAAVPLPGTLPLLFVGIGTLMCTRRR